jgi:hypothetical protein
MQSQTITPATNRYPLALIPKPKDSGYIIALANYGYPGCVRVDLSTKQPRVYAAELTKQYRSPHPFVVVFARFLPDNAHKINHVVLRQFRRFLINPGGIYHDMSLQSAMEIMDRIVTFEIENNGQ